MTLFGGRLKREDDQFVEGFRRVCERKKLKANVGKSKIHKFTLSMEQEPLRVRLGLEEVEKVSEFTLLDSWRQHNLAWRVSTAIPR